MPTENQTVDTQYDAGDMADQAAKAFRNGAKELERVTAERDAALAQIEHLEGLLAKALPSVLAHENGFSPEQVAYVMNGVNAAREAKQVQS